MASRLFQKTHESSDYSKWKDHAQMHQSIEHNIRETMRNSVWLPKGQSGRGHGRRAGGMVQGEVDAGLYKPGERICLNPIGKWQLLVVYVRDDIQQNQPFRYFPTTSNSTCSSLLSSFRFSLASLLSHGGLCICSLLCMDSTLPPQHLILGFFLTPQELLQYILLGV